MKSFNIKIAIESYNRDLSLIKSDNWKHIPSIRKEAILSRTKLTETFLLNNLFEPFFEHLYKLITFFIDFIKKVINQLSSYLELIIKIGEDKQ